MPSDEAAAREHVERRDRLRREEGVAVRRHQHVRLHAQSRRRRGHEGERDERVERLVAAAAQPAVLGRRVIGDEARRRSRPAPRRAPSPRSPRRSRTRRPATTWSVGSWSVKRTASHDSPSRWGVSSRLWRVAALANSCASRAPLRAHRGMSSALPDLPGRLEPKLWTVLREGCRARSSRATSLAGVIVGVVALPLAIAFAIASGVQPGAGPRHRDRRRLPDLARSAAAACRSAAPPAPSS